MNIMISKEHLGTTVYALDLRGKDKEPCAFEVVKVNRRYAILKDVRIARERAYDRETGESQEAINSNFGARDERLFFESMEALGRYQEFMKKKTKVYAYFSGYNTALSNDQTNKIHDVLFPDL